MTKSNFPLNKKDFIIDGFQKMNLSMLEVTLDDNKTYQNDSKIDFLEKIKKVFDELKQYGNTELKAHKFACELSYDFSTTFQGYSFVGNNSKKTLNLIFEETESNVENIYHCNGLEIGNLLSKIYQTVDNDIINDEKANAKPTIDFLIISQKCAAAVNEIQYFEKEIIAKTIYLLWLDKYSNLNRLLHSPPYRFNEFKTFNYLFEQLNEFGKVLKENIAANNAIAEYEKLLPNDESEVLQWLVKHEEVYHNCCLIYYLDGNTYFDENLDEELDEDLDEDLEFYKLTDWNIKIDLADFKIIFQFLEYFEYPHQKYLEKYTTFTIEQQNKYSNNSSHPLWNAVSSLKYHLQQRGML